MKYLYIGVVIAAALSIRVAIYQLRKRRRAAVPTGEGDAGQAPAPLAPVRGGGGSSGVLGQQLTKRLGDVGTIAFREINERIRGRIFRIGTLLILLAVAAAIILPTVDRSNSGATTQTIGVVGNLSPAARELVVGAGKANQDTVHFVPATSVSVAKAGLRSGKFDLAIVDEREVLVNLPASDKHSPADPTLVLDVAEYLGVVQAYRAAGLTPTQARLITNSKPVPVRTLQEGSKSTGQAISVIGLVLLFLMLTQYCTWILIGVMQEKSSRVVEVLLAAVRPIQLLSGKVLGIGLVALGQAALVVGFALVVAKAVGSDLLHGTAPLVLLAELVWLVLGYAFYCWVYAAAGSTAERQDQVQTLALPLSIPILIGYIFSITVASSGQPSLLFKVLAYFPPTAPFCMSVLVGLSQVTWWQFLTSVLITLVATAAMARFAAAVYRRAVLRTGSRVHLRELFARATR